MGGKAGTVNQEAETARSSKKSNSKEENPLLNSSNLIGYLLRRVVVVLGIPDGNPQFLYSEQ